VSAEAKYRFEMSLFNFTTGLLTGLYGGVYLAQNYKVPVAPNPQALYQKAVSWLETLKKDDGKED